ncbi:MAG: hypothetical protein ACTHLZ_17085, partial [Tepidisphaeraceae bacterium]
GGKDKYAHPCVGPLTTARTSVLVLATCLPQPAGKCFNLVQFHLLPLASHSETVLIYVPQSHSTDKHSLNITDQFIRLVIRRFRHRAETSEPVLVLLLQDSAKAEPREAIPAIGMLIVQVILKALSESLPPRQTDIVRPMVPVQDVNALLVPEVGHLQCRIMCTPATEKPKCSSPPLSRIPIDLISAPE